MALNSTPLRPIRTLVIAYVALSWVSAVVAVLTDTNNSQAQTESVVHAVILALTSLLTLWFGLTARPDKPKSTLRLLIIAIILAVALLVTTIVLPLPVWLRVEHIVGLVLMVVVIVLTRQLRNQPASR